MALQKDAGLHFHSTLLQCSTSHRLLLLVHGKPLSFLLLLSGGPDPFPPVPSRTRPGLRAGAGWQRAGRPRGARAIVLDWRILTQMAREKQIGREMNKLYR